MSVVAPGKPLALAVYLAMAPDRRARRNHLVELLWGELEPGSARHQLRNALFYLRGRLGDDFVSADDSFCALSPDVGFDVADFLDAIRRGQFEQALDTYAGAFLEGFASPGCREFEAWADIERAHLRSLALNAGESLCRIHLDAGRFSPAREAAARMVAIDPNAEVGRRLALESVVASGDRLSARVEAERLENWLREQERLADPATSLAIRLAHDLTRSQVQPDGGRSPLAGELVGRESQFSELLAAWSRVGQGRAQFVSMCGVAGVGKTRLLDDFARRLRTLRRRVVSVRAYAGEREVPLAFAAEVVHALAQLPGAIAVSKGAVPMLLALDPRLQDQFPSEQASRRVTRVDATTVVAVGELLAAVSDESAIAILLDDAHWLDPESRSLLGAVIARLETAPILVVSTARHPSGQLPLPEGARKIEVAPLDLGEIHSLVSSIAVLPEHEEWPAKLVQRLAKTTDGIPLEVLASLERLVGSGAVRISDGIWEGVHLDRIDLTTTLHRDALGGLSESARLLAIGIAAAGIPVPRDAIAAIVGDEGTARRDVEALEEAGLVWASDTHVEMTHDLVAERTLRAASAGERAEGDVVMGRALIERTERRLIERGVRLLADNGRVDVASEVVANLVRSRSRGIAPRAAIATILGRPAEDEVVQQFVRRLPIVVRWRAPIRVIASVVGIMLVSAATRAVLHARRADAPAVLEIYEQMPGHERRSAELSLYSTDWFPEQPIHLRLGPSRTDTAPKPLFNSSVVPGQEKWAVQWEFGDRGGVDIRLDGPAGPIRRLTDSPADDVPGSWSPDAQYLAMETSRFDSLAHKRIGILNVATGAVRELTHDNRVQNLPTWSRDGTRIAFAARDFDTFRSDICVTSYSGDESTCWPEPARPFMLGWIDGQHLIELTAADSLSVLDTYTGARRVIASGLRHAQLSPNGDWIAYTKADEPTSVFVASSVHPDEARRIVTDANDQGTLEVFWRREAPPEYLDSLAIGLRLDTVTVGIDYQLRAEGTTNKGTSILVQPSIWRSLTPDIATVDSTGLLTPHKPGIARIALSAGGWRGTSRQLAVVAGAKPHVLVDEVWDSTFTWRWTRFGQPAPRIVASSVIGPAFLNNGDGNFFSGAYSSQTFSSRSGLAIEATVRMPITRTQWQYIALGFTRLDASALRTWDHLTGYIPGDGTGLGCLMSYPNGEGGQALREIGPPGDIGVHVALLKALASGIPTSVRVQVLPDGRCGIALNGEPIWVSQAAVANVDSLQALIEGNSVGTKILVGRLRITSGVSDDINWQGCRGICGRRLPR